MRQIVPSTTALQAFATSARHLSFTRAAVELCVTQGAISQQVAQLESFLGIHLFERVHKRLYLTDAGRAYLARVQPLLHELASATTELLAYGGMGGALRLASMPTFNAQWLVPRLHRFLANDPQAKLEFIPHTRGYDFAQGNLDCAIRFGEGAWPNAVADYLTGRNLIVIFAPSLRKKWKQEPDLSTMTLLHHLSVPNAWPEWFANAGRATAKAHIGPRFDQYSVLIQAVIARLGVALVPACLVESELADGRLIAPFKQPYLANQGYYLCYPEARTGYPPLQTFRAWILAEASRTLAAPP